MVWSKLSNSGWPALILLRYSEIGDSKTLMIQAVMFRSLWEYRGFILANEMCIRDSHKHSRASKIKHLSLEVSNSGASKARILIHRRGAVSLRCPKFCRKEAVCYTHPYSIGTTPVSEKLK